VEHEVDNLLPSSAEIKNVGSITSTPAYNILFYAEVYGQVHSSGFQSTSI
jgi:hypothetical protein